MSLSHLQNTPQQYYNIKLLADSLAKIDINNHPEFQLKPNEFKAMIEAINRKSDFYYSKIFD